MNEKQVLTPEQINAIKERVSKTHPQLTRVKPLMGKHWMIGYIENHTAYPSDRDEDLDFIEHARRDVLALLAHVEAIQDDDAKFQQLRSEFDSFEAEVKRHRENITGKMRD